MSINTLFDEDDQFPALNSSQMQGRSTKKQYQLRNALFQIFLLLSILFLLSSLSTLFQPSSPEISANQSFSILYETDDTLSQTLAYMKQAQQFHWMKDNQDFQQLPICIGIAAQSKVQIQVVKQSIKKQNYRRLRVFSLHQAGKTLKEGSINYFDLSKRIRYQCEQNSIVMLLNSTIKGNLLNQINRIYQKKNIWLTYEIIDGQLLIYSWYQRIFNLVEKNDFKKQNKGYLQDYDHEIIAMAMMQLALNHAENITKHNVVNELNRNSLILRVNTTRHRKYIRSPYQQIFSLREDFQVNKFRMENLYKKMLQNKQKQYIAQKVSLTRQKMLDSQLFLDLLYLPSNHSIEKYESVQYEKKYNFSSLSKELPLCVCVPSHNNIQNNRYERLMLSILQQKYENYHIVFIDDDSTDDTLQQTMKFMKERQFSTKRISYVKNLRRNFATYNILNAAFNYCGNQEIQVMVDGDDELIGKQIFQLLNYKYQYRQNWLVYTSHITNQYSYGGSLPFTSMDLILDTNKKRKRGHLIGHLTTWYVSLLKMVRIEDHKMPNGQWYDTLYDDAFQHPLMQMGGTEHIQFIPEITYLYNRNYGDNDDSTKEKIQYRYELYNILLKKKCYKKIDKIDSSLKNEQVQKQIKKDYGTRYINVFDYNVGSLKKKRSLKQVKS